MNKIIKNSIVDFHGRYTPFGALDHQKLTMGELHHILYSTNPSSGKAPHKLLSDNLIINNKSVFDEKGWEQYLKELKDCANTRNLCPHKGAMTKEKTNDFMKLAFHGKDSFMRRTSRLYSVARALSLI